MNWIIIFNLCLVMSMAKACLEDEFDLDGQRCCKKCPSGMGVSSQCNSTADTSCELCVEGETFSTTNSHADACQTCKECPDHMHVKRACNVTADTECECDKHFYFDTQQNRCLLCDLCGEGYEVVQTCNSTSDTVCQICPNGTYSYFLSSIAKCHACTVCEPHQRMLQKCNPKQDTVCIDVSNIPKDWIAQQKGSTLQSISEKKTENSIDIIPLYCAVLAAVVVGLFGYVIFKHYRRIKETKRGKDPHEDIEYSKASGGDSGIYVEVEVHNQKPSTYSSISKIRDLPTQKRKGMEKAISVSNGEAEDWKLLAKELGYNNRKIAGFELKSRHDSNLPVRHLMHEWGKSENATVTVLLKTLKVIHRDDVAQILSCDMTDLKAYSQTLQIEHNS